MTFGFDNLKSIIFQMCTLFSVSNIYICMCICTDEFKKVIVIVDAGTSNCFKPTSTL